MAAKLFFDVDFDAERVLEPDDDRLVIAPYVIDGESAEPPIRLDSDSRLSDVEAIFSAIVMDDIGNSADFKKRRRAAKRIGCRLIYLGWRDGTIALSSIPPSLQTLAESDFTRLSNRSSRFRGRHDKRLSMASSINGTDLLGQESVMIARSTAIVSHIDYEVLIPPGEVTGNEMPLPPLPLGLMSESLQILNEQGVATQPLECIQRWFKTARRKRRQAYLLMWVDRTTMLVSLNKKTPLSDQQLVMFYSIGRYEKDKVVAKPKGVTLQ